MSGSFPPAYTPESEVLTFKQGGGESLKDAWYRIKNAHQGSTKKPFATILLRNFYIGITSWNRYVLNTITGGNFLGTDTVEAFNVIEGLVGIPPTNNRKNEITLEHVMQRIEVIEDNVPSVDMIREIDKGILDSLNKLDGCLKDIAKSIKSLEPTKASNQTIRIDKLEEGIDTLGTT